VSNYGVATADDARIIAALVEHTHVKTENRRKIHASAHRALVGRNDDELVVFEFDIGDHAHERLGHLICRAVVVKAHKRYRILHAVVMRIKSDKVAHADGLKLAQHHCTVK